MKHKWINKTNNGKGNGSTAECERCLTTVLKVGIYREYIDRLGTLYMWKANVCEPIKN
jgi:hypothetical protein